jgi:hypothetical protein
VNDLFSRCAAAPDFTLTQHFARRERTQHEFNTSAVGSMWNFAARRAKVCFFRFGSML